MLCYVAPVTLITAHNTGVTHRNVHTIYMCYGGVTLYMAARYGGVAAAGYVRNTRITPEVSVGVTVPFG
jgi:hypothetical protein